MLSFDYVGEIRVIDENEIASKYCLMQCSFFLSLLFILYLDNNLAKDTPSQQ